jgi:hypothetical protein
MSIHDPRYHPYPYLFSFHPLYERKKRRKKQRHKYMVESQNIENK